MIGEWCPPHNFGNGKLIAPDLGSGAPALYSSPKLYPNTYAPFYLIHERGVGGLSRKCG